MELTLKAKKEISQALKVYMTEKHLSQDEMSTISNVNIGFINAIYNGKFVFQDTQIKDSYFKRIAIAIGYRYESDFWTFQQTDQFGAIYTELLDAKVNGNVKLIIGDTGIGKTYGLNRFKTDFPQNTYVVTVSILSNLNHILQDLGTALGVNLTVKRGAVNMNKIVNKLRQLKEAGKQPIVIIDESENLGLYALKALKGFYDGIKNHCPLVLIGTTQLLTRLEKLKDKDENGIPQLYRRFKAGIRQIAPINKDLMFDLFFEESESREVRELLSSIADNYGELFDYLEHARREAKRMGVPLSVQFITDLFKL